ncbi:MAG: GNAT family N-acetyltransferase [Chloroflexota bacterium]
MLGLEEQPASQGLADARWRVTLADGSLARKGERRDHLAVEALWAVAQGVYEAPGEQDLVALLTREPNLLWLRGDRPVGALLISRDRWPVATARLLALRAEDDAEQFVAQALPVFEARLAALGGAYLVFHACPAWLPPALAACGYAVYDHVVDYERVGCRVATPARPLADVALRPASGADLPAVLAVDEAAFDPFWRVNVPDCVRAAQKAGYFVVAEGAGQVVGYLTAERTGRRAYIGRIAVLPAQQGRGAGEQLMRHALALMERDGLVGAHLDTEETNVRARALYERLGFRLTGARDAYWAKALGPPG